MNLFRSLAVVTAVVACMSTSWSQTPAPQAGKVAAKAPAAPAQVVPESKVDRQKKVAETMSSTQKKKDDTAKNVIGNLK